MKKADLVFKYSRYSFILQHQSTFYNSSTRCFSNEQKDIEEVKETKLPKSIFPTNSQLWSPYATYWNEYSAIRKARKGKKLMDRLDHGTEWLKLLQGMRRYPTTPSEFFYLLKKLKERMELKEQQYLPEREAVLKPDLAAAHFLLRRGGSIKFVGQENWIVKINKLPLTFAPGLFIEGIKAANTDLYYEGLQNLCRLRHLTTLSLKGLENINDWCMDWISKEYYQTLIHLDISDCKNVTHRGLSCFYRFECLKTLNVGGISESPEFKVACLMLLEIMPELDIIGINLEIPQEIEPVNEEVQKIVSGT